jgi:hypothetical protein
METIFGYLTLQLTQPVNNYIKFIQKNNHTNNNKLNKLNKIIKNKKNIKYKMENMNVDKIAKGMLIPSLIVMLILSVQTNQNAIKALISVYIFMICLVGYIIVEFFNNKEISINSISGFGKFMKSLTVVLIVATMVGMIINLSVNYDKISGNQMPNSYYNFSMLINIFLSIQIIIVVSNLLSENGNMYTLSDKMTMISIFFGQLGIIMFSILVSITIYNYTQG